MTQRNDKRTALLLLFIVAFSIVGYRIGYAVASDAINNATFQAGTQVSDATYTVFRVGSTYYGSNGQTGAVISGAHFSSLMVTLIDVTTVGGKIALCPGLYDTNGETITIDKEISIVGPSTGNYWVESATISDETGTVDYLFNVTADAVTVKNLLLNHAGIAISGDSCNIESNYFYKPYVNGIWVQSGWSRINFNEIWMNETDTWSTACILVDSADNMISWNVLRAAPLGYCVWLRASENWIDHNKLFSGFMQVFIQIGGNNFIQSNYVEKDSTGTFGLYIGGLGHNIISGNQVGEFLHEGIQLNSTGNICSNNVVFNCGQAGDGVRHGIDSYMGSNTITGNTVYDDQVSPTMVYAIYIDSPSDYCIVTGNNLIDAPDGIYNETSHNTITLNILP